MSAKPKPRPITTLLVANRGEIACRILRTARDMGLRTVAVYSEVDVDAPHVGMADRAICLGPGPAGDSYLNAEKVLAAAYESGADAIHPGYGFLSENADFATAVEAAGLVFVGPPASSIRAMGNKAGAKRLMIAAGVPCVPGYEGSDQSDAALIAAAADIGFPLMVKAAAGGGGRGMRRVDEANALSAGLALARSEAANAFGSDELILEKAILGPRHVEVQVFADAHGACIHLGERDCSVQRRHQKVIEEAPCPVMTPALRAEMGAAAVQAARSVEYRGAGTVEFLLDADGAYYFLEMNTRLQVEHPVTEMITGLDLVEWQILVAGGAPLPMTQDDVQIDGHAIEARLYAEDPANGYLPDTGVISHWQAATGPGVRVDGGVTTGSTVSPHYDPMLAKVVAHGPTRDIARERLVEALKETVLFGPVTNTSFLVDVLSGVGFAQGQATTSFLDDLFPDGPEVQGPGLPVVALAAALDLQARQSAAQQAGSYSSPALLGWSSAAPLAVPLELMCAGDTWAVLATARGPGWDIRIAGRTFLVEPGSGDGPDGIARIDGADVRVVHLSDGAGGFWLAVGAGRFQFHRKSAAAVTEAPSSGRILAPMPGLVIDLKVQMGQSVTRGTVLAVLEAMKMQHQIVAPVTGDVVQIAARTGAQVASGDELMIIEGPEE